VKQLFCIVPFLALSFVGCGHNSEAGARHFHLTGEVKALNAQDHTVRIDAAAIPNYMEAMTMDYPIKSAAEFSQLHVGEHVDGTLNVHSDDTYDLSDIHPSQQKK
jgi:Cu/Ag efflux protein CusF